jgi:hypothetical protein
VPESTPQVTTLVNETGFLLAEWRMLWILVNPPSLHWTAATLPAEIHGRCGYFPSHLWMRPMGGSMSPQFEVAEVLDLQRVRENAWKKES